MKIAIVGTGNIGGTLGKKWAAAGHQITYGARDPANAKVRDLLKVSSGMAQAASIPEAIAAGAIVLFAIPWAAVPEVAAANASVLNGKIIIDATNHFFSGPPINNFAALQAAAPNAVYLRAFNALGWEVFENPAFGELQSDLFYTGPEGEAQRMVEQLIEQTGLHPVWVGDNDRIEIVDRAGELWVTLAFRRGRGRQIALKLLER